MANTGGTVKNVLLIAIIVGAAVFASRQLKERRLIQAENEAVAFFNSGDMDAAIAAYARLLPKREGPAALRVRKQIASCYKAKGEDPGLSGAEQAKLYQQALEYDPDCITDEFRLKLVRSYAER